MFILKLNNTPTDINPKLPMRDKALTKDFYLNNLGFIELEDYLMVIKVSAIPFSNGNPSCDME